MVVDRIGGSRWLSALPTGHKQTDFGGGLGEREAKWSLPQPARVGNADQQSAGNSADSEKSAAPIYGGWFRVPSGGSKWQSALPTGSKWNRALPG